MLRKILKIFKHICTGTRLPGFKRWFLIFFILFLPCPNLVQAQAAEDFTIIVLPDTQYYSWIYPEIYLAQTQWIVDTKDDLNTVYVAHEGDLVQNAGIIDDWENAHNAMGLLEDSIATNLSEGIPYGVLAGDHDQPTTLYNQYFGVGRFKGKSYYGGSYSATKNDNNFTLFSAGGMDFIVINIAAGVTSSVLNWADALLKQWNNRRAIVVSHILLSSGNPASFTYSGQLIYTALKDNPNLFLMLGGHNAAEGMRTDVFNGNTIYSLLANYQVLPNGGNGWLRIMRFSPATDTITVTTYSPYLDQYGNDPVSAMGSDTTSQEFTLSYAMNDGEPETPPTAPTGLNAAAVSSSEVDLSWTDTSDNETSFQIEWSSNGGASFTLLTSANSEDYAHVGLTPGTEYCYRVRAINAAGSSAYTAVRCATTESSITSPSAPTGLVATAVSLSEVDLSWADNSDNETGFEVEWSSNGGATFALLTVAPVNSEEYTHVGLTPNTQYCYRVRAINAAGKSGYTAVQCATTQSNVTLPSAPIGLRAEAISFSEVDLSWADTSGNETGFEIERSSDAGINFEIVAAVSANSAGYVDKNLEATTEYCYRVRAVNAAGVSDYTNVQCATTTQVNVTSGSNPSPTQDGGGGGSGGGCFIQSAMN